MKGGWGGVWQRPAAICTLICSYALSNCSFSNSMFPVRNCPRALRLSFSNWREDPVHAAGSILNFFIFANTNINHTCTCSIGNGRSRRRKRRSAGFLVSGFFDSCGSVLGRWSRGSGSRSVGRSRDSSVLLGGEGSPSHAPADLYKRPQTDHDPIPTKCSSIRRGKTAP